MGDLPLLAVNVSFRAAYIGYFAQHQMDALDGHASPMLQLARIADKQLVKLPYALS